MIETKALMKGYVLMYLIRDATVQPLPANVILATALEIKSAQTWQQLGLFGK